MVYENEDTTYGYKAVYVCKQDKLFRNMYHLLNIPKSTNFIYAIIKIEIPKGVIVVDPYGQKKNDDSGFHKLRCGYAKFVEAVKYCYVYIEEKIDESFTNDNILGLKFNAAIDAQLIEVSEKEVIDYNESKDIKYCSMYTFANHFGDSFTDSDFLKPNDFMMTYPYLNTNDDLICASGIHFFETEKEVYNYLLRLNN